MTFVSGRGRQLLTLAAVLALACAGAFAQSTEVDKLSYEVALPLTSIGFSGTFNVPANVLASIQGGALEIRQNVEYVRASKRLHVKHLLVQRGTATPAPAAAIQATVEDYWIGVSDSRQGADPRTVVMMGTIDQVGVDSPFGRQGGLLATFSTGYEAATPAKFNDITLVLSGRMTTYAPTGTGTFSFVGTAPGPTPTGPVADAGPDISTAQSEIQLDGSKSSHPDNDTLTYSWRVITGTANIIGATSVRPRVQLGQNFATYVFELTVTDSKGNKATDTVKVVYSGRF